MLGLVEIYLLSLKQSDQLTILWVGLENTRNGSSNTARVKVLPGQKLHPVEEVVDILEGNEALENAKTLEFMARFGLAKVRGGKWVEIELSDPPLALLASHNGKCFKCGKKGHMISNCPLESSDHLKQNLTLPLASYCLRCGHDGHSIRSCFAFTDLNGEFLEDIPCCNRCGYSNHTKHYCYAKYDKWGQKI